MKSGISFFLNDNILTGILLFISWVQMLMFTMMLIFPGMSSLSVYSVSNPVMYDLLSKCNCVSIEGELLVLMRLSHQLGRLVSKLRQSEIPFLAVILYHSFQSVNVVKYACCPVFRRLDVLVVVSRHACLTPAH